MFIQQKIMFMNTRKCVDIFQSTKTDSFTAKVQHQSNNQSINQAIDK
jgi:hypothetical protein